MEKDSKFIEARDWSRKMAVQLEKNLEIFVQDSVGVPTIGIGYAGIVKGRNGWSVKSGLRSDLEAAGVSVEQRDLDILSDIARELNKPRSQREDTKAMTKSLGITMEPEQSRTLFDHTYGDYYDQTEKFVGRDVFNNLPPERQGALSLVTFQSPRAMKNAGPAISAGIKSGNVATVVGELSAIGEALGDVSRYAVLGGLFADPSMNGKDIITAEDGNLSNFAKRVGATLSEIIDLNPEIGNPDVIRAGTALNVPSGSPAMTQLKDSKPAVDNHIRDFEDLLGSFAPAPAPSSAPSAKTALGGLLGALGLDSRNIGTDTDVEGALQGLAAIGAALGIDQARPAGPHRAAPSKQAVQAAAKLADETLARRVMASNAYNTPSHALNPAAADFVKGYYDNAYPEKAAYDDTGRMKDAPAPDTALDKAKAIEATGARNVNRTAKAATPAPNNPIADVIGLTPQNMTRGIAKSIQAKNWSLRTEAKKAEVKSRAAAIRQARTPSLRDVHDFDGVSFGGTKRQGGLATLGGGTGGDTLGGGVGGNRLDGSVDIGRKTGDVTPTGAVRTAPAIGRTTAVSGAGVNPGGDRMSSSKGGGASSDKSKDNREEKLPGGTSLGRPGGYTNGSYRSGINSRGKPTGGVKLDKHKREVNALGFHTRDIIGHGDGSASDGNTRVICTELVRQGRMDAALQQLDVAFTVARLSSATVRGYHVWAVPYVRLMKRSRLATALAEPLARWRAEEIAYQLGKAARPNYKGKVVRTVGEPVCRVIGKCLGE